MPWGSEVRFDHEVIARRSLGTVGGSRIIVSVCRSMCIDGTHGNRKGTIGRRGDPSKYRAAVSRSAVISGGGHHGDPRANRAFDGFAQRIVTVRLQYGRAERQVDDPDVELLAVVHDPV